MSLGVLCAVLLAGCGGNAPNLEPGGPQEAGGNPVIETALHYIKASNTDINDDFGFSTALSADGNTLAVGAHREASNARGINPPQNNEDARNAGAVYVFVRSGNTWVQQAYLKASNSDLGDAFGYRLALSGDGNTLAVGATGEDSGDVHNPDSTAAADSGAVYVFARADHKDWHQQAYLKSQKIGERDSFGASLALSRNGNTLAVGVTYEDVEGAPGMAGMSNAGAVVVFGRTDTTWVERAHLRPRVPGRDAQFGYSVALSEDGATLAVGAIGEINQAGLAYVFMNGAGGWSQEAILNARNLQDDDRFGFSVALSADGETLAVGAIGESSGNPADPLNNDLTFAGAVYVFTHSAGSWSQQAYVKASNPGNNDEFGAGLALSPDGKALVVGARHEASDATGTNGAQDNDNLLYAGAAYVFTRSIDGSWPQRAYVKASNTGDQDYFGSAVAMSADARTFAVGAPTERSKATGVDGDQLDNSVSEAGAVYLLNTLN